MSCPAELRTSASVWPSQNFGFVLMVKFSTGLAHANSTAGAEHVFIFKINFKILVYLKHLQAGLPPPLPSILRL